METPVFVTSQEQAKLLLDAGLSPDTADLHYSNGDFNDPFYLEDKASLKLLPYREAKKRYEEAGREVTVFFTYSPAWSLGALWQILNTNNLNYSPNTLAFSSSGLLNGLVSRVLYSIRYYGISQEYLTTKEATEE